MSNSKHRAQRLADPAGHRPNPAKGHEGVLSGTINGLRDQLRQTPFMGLLAVLALALAARLVGIGSRPIWYDEAFTILFAEKGPAAMLLSNRSGLSLAASDVHPLAYYVILWEWMRLFGESLLSVRALSVLAGAVTVIPIYFLTRDLFGAGTALAAGVVYSVAPFQVHYGQEIRMYVFLSLWLVLATYCYWRGSRSPHWRWWLGFAVFAAVAMYTQYLAAFYLVPLAGWPLLNRNWRVLKDVLLAACLSIVISLPWLIDVPEQFAKVSKVYWIARPAPFRLLTLLLTFVTNLPLPGWQLAVGLFIALGLTAVGLVQTIRALRGKSPDAGTALWVLYLAFAPPALLFMFSQWIPLYLERALLPSGAIFCIWLGWTLSRKQLQGWASLLTIAMVLIGFSMGLYEHISDGQFPYGRFADLARTLESQREPADAIIHSSKLSLLPTLYFGRDLPQSYIVDPAGTPVDTLAPEIRQMLGLQSEPDLESAAEGAGRVWYILFDESNQEYVQAGYREHPDLTWLRARYRLVESSDFGAVRVYLFSQSN